MAIKNEIDIASADGDFIDTRNIKADVKGIKVRLYGDQTMGYAYYQNSTDDEGKDIIKNVKSNGEPVMENQREGWKGAEQKPTKNLYSVAWDYKQEKPVVITLDKVAILTELLGVEKDDDLASMVDYDFRISFDGNEAPANKYKVVRLDKTDLTEEQEKALGEFYETVDLEAFADGGKAIEDTSDKDTKDLEEEF